MDGIVPKLEDMRENVNRKASEKRDSRDELNKNVGGFLSTRNDFNRQVRELISEVQRQKGIRDEANGAVREAKSERADKNQGVREAKEKLRELSPEPERNDRNDRRGRREKEDTPASLKRKIEKLEDDFGMGKLTGKNEKKFEQQINEMRRKLRKMSESENSNVELKEARDNLRLAIDEQEVAHQAVTTAADTAQEAHDLMIKLSDEVDRLREKADASQAQVRRVKREADREHQSYIVSLRCLHSIQDILRAKSNKDKGIDTGDKFQVPARVEVQDLMSKLMSGETLSTDELMALQRGG
jgi:exonuclease SbcC